MKAQKTSTVQIPKTLLRSPDTLKSAPYNPRKISKSQLNSLVASIDEYGFVEPLVIQKGTRVVIGGHQRLAALEIICKENGEQAPKIPVVELDVSDRQAKLLNLALNKIGGEFDKDQLTRLLSSIVDDELLTADEVDVSGFSEKEINKLIAPDDVPNDDDLNDFAKSVTLSLHFDSVTERDVVKALLKSRVVDEGGTSGTIVHGLLT